MLIVRAAHVRAIEGHARETYPEECCGFLLGPEPVSEKEPRRIGEIRRAKNVAASNRERRYEIDPKETFAVTKALEGTTAKILGFYHSHPDHPAVPSTYDESRAWLWWSYLILSIVHKDPGDLRAWTLDERTRVFKQDELRVE